jgi:preprotein translocase subunit SecG
LRLLRKAFARGSALAPQGVKRGATKAFEGEASYERPKCYYLPRCPAAINEVNVNAPIAIGQDIIGIFLMIAILMQARGSGLSATFGGDSSVYRSRRGIERRLWQFTILLAVLFCFFSEASFVIKP